MLKTVENTSASSKNVICVCQHPYDEEYDSLTGCDNASCQFGWLHYSCIGIKKAPRGTWYCQEGTQGYMVLSGRHPGVHGTVRKAPRSTWYCQEGTQGYIVLSGRHPWVHGTVRKAPRGTWYCQEGTQGYMVLSGRHPGVHGTVRKTPRGTWYCQEGTQGYMVLSRVSVSLLHCRVKQLPELHVDIVTFIAYSNNVTLHTFKLRVHYLHMSMLQT